MTLELADASAWAMALFDVDRSLLRKKFLDGYRAITFGEMLRRTDELGAFFAEQGWGPGRRLLVSSTDDVELALLTLAAMRWGHTAVVLHPAAHTGDPIKVFDAADAHAAIFDGELIARWDLTEGPKILRLRSPARGLLPKLAAQPPGRRADGPIAVPVCRSDVAIALPTSGTTGDVKLVPITFGNLEAQVRIMAEALALDASTRTLNLLPMSHIDGLVTGILLSLHTRTTSVRMPRVTIQDLRDLFPTIYAHEVTHLLVVPSYLAVMLRKIDDLGEAFVAADGFRNVLCTAAYLAESTWEEFEARTKVRIVNMYGLTETGNILFSGPGDDSHRVGSIGKPVGVDVLVVDDDHHPVGPGQAGELLVSGEAIISEYWSGNRQGFVEIDGKRWFSTGDLAVREHDGWFRMVGRKKRIIITGGFNVHPEVIERELTRLPAVTEAGVVDMPDAIWGERVVACVVTDDKSLTRRDVFDALSKRLNNFQMPRELHFVDQLPKGRSGKVPSEALRRTIESLRAARTSVLTGSIESRVFALAANAFRLPLDRITGALGSDQEGWDSMAHLDFILSLEEAFAVNLDANQMMRIGTLADAVALIEERIATLDADLAS